MPSTESHARSPDSEQALRRAVANRPDDAQAHAALTAFLCAAGRVEEALAHIEREAIRQPAMLWPLSIKAGIFSSERRAAEALDVHRLLVARAPGVAVLWAHFGSDLAAVGEVDEAAAAFRAAVRRAPDFGAAWLGLANLRSALLDDADLAEMEKGAALARDPYQKIQLLFALGRAYGTRGAFDTSFDKFSEANSLRETVVPYDAARLTAWVDAHSLLPAPFLATAPISPAQANAAIFIVGMPRSGSTLVEQILASHPEVEGTGELFALPDVVASIGAFDSPVEFVRRLQTLTHAEAMQLGTDYLTRAGRYRRTDRPYFTDKMPANWRFVALIRRILPGARIIDVRRDPLACCFSAYTTYFNRHTEFPNMLEDLGEYYRQYERLMDMLRPLMPERLYGLDHAQLVSDTEQEIRALLRFLQLPFSFSCLRPEENPRPIYTPSAQQVRVPVHHQGDRSHVYLRWLAPLQAALEAG